MKISITYEGSWGNSFLSGSNNESPYNENTTKPKKAKKLNGSQKRKFVATSKSLGNPENYKIKDVSKDTVMGILNRLIGDQRKLYQSRESDDYYFKTLEDKISFENDIQVETNEMIYLRKPSKVNEPGSFSGIMKYNGAFNEFFSENLWSILFLEFNELLDFIIDDVIVKKLNNCSPLKFKDKFDKIKTDSIDVNKVNLAIDKLNKYFESIGGINGKNIDEIPTLQGDDEYITPKTILIMFTRSLYKQFYKLQNDGVDCSALTTKHGGLPGISANNITLKDLFSNFSNKKYGRGNPYEKHGNMLKKRSGTIVIHLDIDRENANQLYNMIQNAAVNVFYVGKKGIGYVSDIRP